MDPRCENEPAGFVKGRHFTATAAIVEGSDIRSAAAIMGHAQPSTTLNVYGHVVAGAKAATMEKVGGLILTPTFHPPCYVMQRTCSTG